MLGLAANLFNKLFTADKWNIGYVYQSQEELISTRKLDSQIKWLEEDNVDYAADPFVIDVDHKPRIYYEELNFWKGKGEIMMIDDFTFTNKKRVEGIKPGSIHLSYPFLINSGGKCFCVPETAASKEIALYQIDQKDPTQLIKQKVLIEGESFVDTSILHHNEQYWLFTTISGKHTELYIYYADELDGEYKPHQLNPIPVERRVCRAAGDLFKVNGKIYRPTQNPTARYGGSIIINEIVELCHKHFKSTELFELMPDQNYNRGMHNISFANGIIVFDGKRKVINALVPLKKLVRKIRMRF
ncbi:glucosamine inositolphosphorylceramide transferase family protein [Pedobacter sandarakinus]|uniref:glucosamine inositolphosphorylceramide transferase family protein n=1 Tax=Pedobacter sandarakinus TaxID=353156 RepID=UPI002246AA1A|nr:hypothetical protein [Pedobacter sandarakinus]MCX2574305.1 hypothetical protein [Pedobacter sandarakinus]